MPPIVAIAELRFEDTLETFRPFDTFHAAVTGQLPPQSDSWPVLNGDIRLDIPDRQVRVRLRAQSLAVIHSGRSTVGGYVPTIAEFFGKSRRIIEGHPISRLGVRSHWVAPFPGELDQLLDHFQRTFVGRNPLASETADLGVIIDIGKDPQRGRVHLGPMEREQLVKSYLPFPDAAIGLERFLFVDVDLWTFDLGLYGRDSLEHEIRARLMEEEEMAQRFIDAFPDGAG